MPLCIFIIYMGERFLFMVVLVLKVALISPLVKINKEKAANY